MFFFFFEFPFPNQFYYFETYVFDEKSCKIPNRSKKLFKFFTKAVDQYNTTTLFYVCQTIPLAVSSWKTKKKKTRNAKSWS